MTETEISAANVVAEEGDDDDSDEELVISAAALLGLKDEPETKPSGADGAGASASGENGEEGGANAKEGAGGGGGKESSGTGDDKGHPMGTSASEPNIPTSNGSDLGAPTGKVLFASDTASEPRVRKVRHSRKSIGKRSLTLGGRQKSEQLSNEQLIAHREWSAQLPRISFQFICISFFCFSWSCFARLLPSSSGASLL